MLWKLTFRTCSLIRLIHVVQQSSGKCRLILNLSYLNKFVWKQSVRYEDIRTLFDLFQSGYFFPASLSILNPVIITLKFFLIIGNALVFLGDLILVSIFCFFGFAFWLIVSALNFYQVSAGACWLLARSWSSCRYVS